MVVVESTAGVATIGAATIAAVTGNVVDGSTIATASTAESNVALGPEPSTTMSSSRPAPTQTPTNTSARQCANHSTLREGFVSFVIEL